ncbi:MAG: hypothetical protein Q9M94_00810 [Candidatus Gracilibacteria bacterium]|nr:hypothetical protein [Candidatus Gracilibacteria bacterium]MDQ7022438.1 hypothetical protein [Candidatus Gracilibacteria bacterium]
MIIKNGKKYYTLNEAKIISDKRIEKMGDKFIEKVKQKRLTTPGKENLKKVFDISLKVKNYA